MKKVYVLYGDAYWHLRDVAEAFLEGVFEEPPVFTDRAQDIPWEDMKNQVALFISLKSENAALNNRRGVDHWITPEREQALYRYVENGGGALFLHAGLVGIYLDSVYHKITGGAFLNHPPGTAVTYLPVNKSHPLLSGVEAFTELDEKYVCQIDPDVEVLLAGADGDHAGTISGWCKTLGKGRTVSFAPGHTLEVANNPNVKRFVKNAAAWLMEGHTC